MPDQSQIVRDWMKQHRAPYMREQGPNARYYYFDFDESGNVMIPGTLRHLLLFFRILTPKDKETFFKLVAPEFDLNFNGPSTASWDFIPNGNVSPRFITMEEYLLRRGVDTEKLRNVQ